MVYLFHYKDRSKFFLICALKNFFSIFLSKPKERERRERTRSLTTLASSFLALFFFSLFSTKEKGRDAGQKN